MRISRLLFFLTNVHKIYCRDLNPKCWRKMFRCCEVSARAVCVSIINWGLCEWNRTSIYFTLKKFNDTALGTAVTYICNPLSAHDYVYSTVRAVCVCVRACVSVFYSFVLFNFFSHWIIVFISNFVVNFCLMFYLKLCAYVYCFYVQMEFPRKTNRAIISMDPLQCSTLKSVHIIA